MPSERYIAPSEEEVRKWEEEKEAKQKLDAQRYALIESALRKLKKDELIELLMGLDTYDPAVRWSIEAEIRVKKPSELIVHDLRQAIEIATLVDSSQLNSNFAYSWQAYEETERGFSTLVGTGQLDLAKVIAIEFMKKASYQVECSDEGLMVEQIEATLKPLIQAVENDQVHVDRDWAIAMLQVDRTGSICRRDLEKIVRGVDPARPDSAR